MRARTLAVVALASSAWAAVANGCAARPVPCVTPGACGSAQACVAGACRPLAEAPVPQGTRRIRLLPTELAVVTSRGRWSGTHVPFGCESAGEVVLLLRFPTPFGNQARIAAAYLVLEPEPGVMQGPAPVRIDVMRITEPWAAERSSWQRLPSLSSAEATVLASPWGGRVLSVDITSQVRRWTELRHDEYGLALRAPAQNPIGVRYALGLTGGSTPKLDVYLQ